MTNRDQLIQEAFERGEAFEYNLDYEELKTRFDGHQKLVGARYVPGSPREIKFLKFKIQWLEGALEGLENAYKNTSGR